MRAKTLTIAAVSACAVIAFAVPATAGNKADTKVTIKQNSGDFFGFVKSSKPKRCADERKVDLMKQKGSRPKPSRDQKVASDTASKQGKRYRWDTGNTGLSSGKYYARAKKIRGCKGDISKTLRAER